MRKTPLPTPAILAVVARQGRLLLVRRANPPDATYWGFPGGHIESGETLLSAAVRELREETGVIAKAGHVLTAVDALNFDDEGLRHHFVLVAVICHWLEGEGNAADDALETGWFSPDAIATLGPMVSSDVEAVARLALEESA
ncbi:NUDIX hydrolase [Marinobacter sp. GN3S48]|uniref:NUDIX hydrolase n=1 Tax=Marinobacter sp. GN3S48 TaxID=3382302 RepID=UPI00387B4222